MSPKHDDLLDELYNEVRLLFNALVQRGETLHADRGVTTAQRAIMEYLLRRGASRVSAIARDRRVSRQHVQSLVNPLLDSGYLTTAENPEHKRSKLIDLTATGRATVTAMRARESRFLRKADPGIPARELKKAADTLRTARAAIEDAAPDDAARH